MDVEITLDDKALATVMHALARDKNYHDALGELLWSSYAGNRLALAQRLKVPGTTFVESIEHAKRHLVEKYLLEHQEAITADIMARVEDETPMPLRIIGRPGRRKKVNADER